MYKVLNYPVNSVDLADNIHTRNVEKKALIVTENLCQDFWKVEIQEVYFRFYLLVCNTGKYIGKQAFSGFISILER